MRVSFGRQVAVAGTLAAALAAASFAAATPAFALEQGDVLVRLRGIAVVPTDDSGGISPDLQGASLAAQPTMMPELDFTYMATDNVGLELILATTHHDIDGQGAIGGLNKVGDTWLLPPTLLVQWHFMPQSHIRPYVGAGVNYTISYGENASASLENALGGPTTIKLDNSLGWALQAGVDYDVGENWFVNADIKYIDMSMDAEIMTGGTKRTAKVGIDPLVLGLGVGYRF